MTVTNIDQRIFLLYHNGYLHRKKENNVISTFDIIYAEIDIQSDMIENSMMMLDFAMIRGDIDTVNWLVCIGLCLSEYNNKDMVLLSIASNNVNMIKWVIDNNINIHDHYEHNLIDYALKHSCSRDMIKYLVSCGIQIIFDVKIINANYCEYESERIIKLLK
jgi:hypothetical protein